jgi:hypothetical protein
MHVTIMHLTIMHLTIIHLTLMSTSPPFHGSQVWGVLPEPWRGPGSTPPPRAPSRQSRCSSL